MNKVMHHLHRAIECNPDFSEAHVILAQEYKDRDDFLHYVDYLNKAIDIDRKLILESEERQKDYAHQNLFGLVRKLFFLEMDQKRHLSNLLIEMGTYHFAKKDINKAQQFYNDAESIDPLYGDVYYRLGKIQLKHKKHKKACQYFIQCIERDIQHSGANIELGKYYQRKKNFHLAEVHFFCGLESNPYNASVHILICKLYLTLKKLEPAKHQYDTAFSLGASVEDKKRKDKISI
jgi:tetratricopeptide (TPR) repeat protein